MAKKLTDTQLVILSSASQREDGSIFPLADSVTLVGGAKFKTLESLLNRSYVEEVDGTPDWRGTDADVPKTLKITDAGLAAIGIGDGTESGSPEAEMKPPKKESVRSKQKRGGKTEAVLKLLRHKQGATVAALQDATGWQPHSVRAALTGLRKKGIAVDRGKNTKGETIYRAAAA